MTNETDTMQDNQTPLSEEVQQQEHNQTPLSEEVQQQDDIQTPSEDDQQQDNNLNEHIPTDKQVIDCVEAIITPKNKTNRLPTKGDRKRTVKPKVVSLAQGQDLHIKLPNGMRTCVIQFISISINYACGYQIYVHFI